MGDQNQTTFDLRHYLQVLWRRRLIVVQAVVIVPLVVFAISYSQAKSYQATARVMVESQMPTINVITGQNLGSQTPDSRQIQTLAKFVVTPAVAQRAVTQLGWNETPQSVMKNVTAEADPEANVIAVTATRPTPDAAQSLANTFASQFVDWRRENQQKTITSAIDLVDEQIAAATPGTTSYEELIARRDDLRVLKTLTTGGVSVGQEAQVPSAPVSPKPARDAALALGAGLILGIGLAFLREALDVKIHSVEELRQLTDVPIIGAIEALPKDLRQGAKLVTLIEPRGPAAETYRFLRTNLDFVNFNHDVKSIMVTSPLPSQGKSTTIANLAVVMLRAGKRVAVVEGDLRRPSLHRYFQVHNSRGLTSVVSGAATLKEARRLLTFHDLAPAVTSAGARVAVAQNTASKEDVARSNGLQLQLLTSGPLPPNPGEMVTSQQLSDLLDELKKGSDYVLVDAPPIFAVGDAAALAGKVDGVLVIVKLEDTTRDMLREVETFLARVPARALGIVVTNVPKTSHGSGYRYGSYYE